MTDTLTLEPAPQSIATEERISRTPRGDREALRVETQRMPGGPLDPDSWTTPRGDRLATFLNTEPDQQRIDSFAYEWLQTGTEAQAKGQGGGVHEEFREGLRQYAEFRKARGEQPFQYLKQAQTRADQRAAREQVPFFRKLFADPERMAEAFPEEQREAFMERFRLSLDPAGEKQRTAGVILVSTMTGKPAEEVADLWPQYREAYGRDVLGISGPLDDAVFYRAAGQALEKEAKDAETAATIAQQAQRAAIHGRPLSHAIDQTRAATGENWKKFEPAARAAYAGILSEFSDTEIKAGRALFEAVADMQGKAVADIAQGDGKKAAWVIALENYGAADQPTRDRIMALLAMQAQAEGEDIQNYFQRLGAAAASGFDMLTIGTGTLAARGNVEFFEQIAAKETDPAEKARMQTEINRMKGTATFAQDLATAGVKVRRYLDDKREGFWDTFGDWGVMAAESLPVMGAAALPYGAGLPAVVAAYGERNISELRREQPDADPDTLAAIAYTAAPIEAGIDRLQWLTLGARLPRLNARLLQYGKPGAVAVGLGRIGTVTAAETVQEVGQDLTRPMVQELAAVLSEEIDGPNWSAVLSKEAEALGDIAGVSLIFGIIGGTGSTITDYVRAPRLATALQDRDGLALAGYSPEIIEKVATLATENPAAAAEALKAAQIETPAEERRRNSEAARERLESEAATPAAFRTTTGRVTSYGYPDDATPDSNSAAGIGAWVSEDEQARIRAGEITPNRLRPGDLAVSRDIEAEFRRAGVSPGDTVTIRLDDGTELAGRWMDRTAESYDGRTLTGRFDIYSPDGANPLDGKQVVAWSSETTGEALADSVIPTLSKQPDGKIQVNFPDARAALYDDQEQALEAVREWEQEADIDTTRAVREYLDFLTDYHASNPEATFTGRQTSAEPTLETWAGNSKERIAKANARIDIMMRQAGTDMGIERPLLSDVPILGTSRNIRAGAITRMVAEINRTGTPLTVIEEAAESVGKWLMEDSKVSESKMIGWIRATEQQTRTKILADNIATMPETERRQEIAEAFSYIARNNAVGRIQESALPAQVKAFFRAFKEMIAQALRIAAEFARLRSEGKIDPEFAYWLDVAAGIEPEFQMDNLTRQMESEILAESMEGFTEIQEALKGRLPHPDTLEQRGDPLAGEVRRLYEGIIENPDSGANKAARTRKANEFFMPKGQMDNLDEIRRALNEQGFDFATPAEMIEAADLSINYGRKQFGTIDPANTDSEGDTFSITLRTDPLLAAIEAQIRAPEKKAEVYQKMKARVAAVKRRFEERRGRGEFDTEAGEIDRARFEQIRDIAILEAIGKALPPDIRGKIVGSFRRVADLKTSKARADYMTALLPKIERALEAGLQKHYRAAIRREFDRAEVKVSESRTRGGKIGAVAHAIIEQARQAMKLRPEQADATAEKFRDELETAPSLTPEQLEELDGKIAALELFQDFENADSARMAEGLQLLRDVRTEGRKEWLAILAERRALREHRIKTLRKGMNLDRPIDFAERPRTKRKGEKLAARINEGFMEWMLSNSQKIRRLGELTDDPAVIATVEQIEGDFLEAELAENDMNRADNQALALAMRSIFGVSTEYAVARKLRELTATDGDIPVTKIEGFKEEEIRVPKNLVESLIRGEASGFTDAKGRRVELDPYDVAALDAAWEKFTEMEDADQNRRRIVTFTRRVSKGERRTLGELNQLEALQILLTMNQPDQGTKMEALGFDETTRTELESYLKPEVKALGAWMVEYLKADTATVDAIHRAEKGVGLGLVENYFPIRNDVSRADSSGLSLDGQPAQQGGRSVSFIKERVTNYANPAVVNALAVFLSHRAQVNFWKSHVAPLREWAGVIRDDGFSAAVKTRMGETYYASLARTLDRIEAGGTLNAKALAEFERSMKGLLKTFALGTLGMRISTILVNATAALNVFFEVPAAKLLKGALQVMKRPEAFKDAFNSKPIRRRLEEGATFEAKLAKASGPSARPLLAVSNSLAEKGMFPINLVDTGTNLLGAAAVWEDTRAAAVRAGVEPEAAKAMADAKVERLLLRSAQPTTRLARSEFEQRVLDNPLAAFFALFVSEPRKNLAITYMAVRELATGKGTAGKAMAAQQAGNGLIFYLAAEFVVRSLYSAFAKAEDDEEDDLFARWWNRLTDAKAWGYHMATGHLRGVPVYGEFWNAAMAKSFDQPVFDKSPNPILKLTTIPGNVEDVFTGTTEEQTKAATRIVQSLGTVIPGGSVAAQGANVADFSQALATSNGVSFSDEDRARRIKARFESFKKSLEEIHGPTMQPTGKAGRNGKPATKTDKRIQAAKWAAMTDRLRADLAPASPELRAIVLESVQAPADVKRSVARELKITSAPTP